MRRRLRRRASLGRRRRSEKISFEAKPEDLAVGWSCALPLGLQAADKEEKIKPLLLTQ